jgi:hypothetical protein
LDGSLPDLIQPMKAQGLEGLVGTRADGRYEPGQRSGAWLKMRNELKVENFSLEYDTERARMFEPLRFVSSWGFSPRTPCAGMRRRYRAAN